MKGGKGMTLNEVAQTQPDQDRSRWIALYVLCAGVLMIVLDVTVVNVALPVDPGRPRLLAVEPRLGRQRLPDRLRRPAAARPGASATCSGARTSSWPASPSSRSPRSSAALAQSQEMLVAARFVQGIGGAMTSAVILGMIVTMFPEPREQAKAIGVYAFVASAGGTIGLLAGGVLTESINWHWIFFINVPIGDRHRLAGDAADRPRPGHRPRRGRRHPRRDPDHHLADARRLHDRQAGGRLRLEPTAQTLGLGAASLALLVAFIVREATRGEPAHAAAHLPLAQRLGRERGPGAAGRRDVRHVLHGLAVHAARCSATTRSRSASRSCPRR